MDNGILKYPISNNRPLIRPGKKTKEYWRRVWIRHGYTDDMESSADLYRSNPRSGHNTSTLSIYYVRNIRLTCWTAIHPSISFVRSTLEIPNKTSVRPKLQTQGMLNSLPTS